MLTPNLSLDDASGDEIAFNLQAYLPDGARRIDITTTMSEPRLLLIQHTATGKGPAVVDRHLVSATMTKDNVDTGGPKKLVVNFTIAEPRASVFSANDVYDLVAAIVDFVSDGGFSGTGLAGTTNLAAIRRGES